jgi:transposase-like protein
MTDWTKEELEEFLKKYKITDGRSAENAFVDHFKGLMQALLEEEMKAKLGYSKYDWKNKETDNSRNGHSKKTIQSDFGQFEVKIPRDTKGEFEPQIVKKHERRVSSGIEEKIIGLYAKGLSTRDIESHMNSIYGLELSAEMISTITDKVLPLVKEWQERPLDNLYPIIFLDGIIFNVKSEGVYSKKTIYLVYAITMEGKKDVLGIWISDSESSKFWMSVLMDLKKRGMKDVLIISVDGLKGFKDAITAVFPQTDVQKCIVHQIRNSTKFVNYADLKAFCADMKKIYTAATENSALEALSDFETNWKKKYAYAIKSWKDNWANLSTMYKYPPEIRKLIYTTNAIEGLNRRIRKVTKSKGSFPHDEALLKLLYLIIMDVSRDWKKPVYDWSVIISQLRVYYPERVNEYL